MCCDDRKAWPPRKAAKAPISLTTKVTTANTRAFAHNTGSRVGTAEKVARIIPVPFLVVDAVFERVVGEFHERLLQRCLQRRQLFERDGIAAGDQTDLGAIEAVHLEHSRRLAGDAHAGTGQEIAQFGGLRSADPD